MTRDKGKGKGWAKRAHVHGGEGTEVTATATVEVTGKGPCARSFNFFVRKVVKMTGLHVKGACNKFPVLCLTFWP
jgi:hypothetical protein